MKVKREIILLMLLELILTGCSRADDPYRVDTVVRIPVNPTDAPTETLAEATEVVTDPTEAAGTEPEETEEPTETVPETTEPEKKQSTGGSKSSGGTKRSSGKNDSTKTTEPPKETDPPKETQLPATEPAETEPAAAVHSEEGEEQTEPPATEPEVYDISGYSVGSLEYSILDQINAARSEAGLGALSLNSRLSAIASCRGYEISQVWSHTRPDGRGYSSVLSDYGYGAGTVTELLAYVSGGGDAAAIVDKWLSSDSHKGSMLSESYTTVGIGVYCANGYTYICCLMVG